MSDRSAACWDTEQVGLCARGAEQRCRGPITQGLIVFAYRYYYYDDEEDDYHYYSCYCCRSYNHYYSSHSYYC